MATPKQINYIVYDIETGGFGVDKVAITEVALIALNGETLEEIERYETLIQPYGDLGYGKEAEAITGITMDMLMADGKPAKQVVKEVNDFIVRQGTGRITKPILCGHNIRDFDNPFMIKLFGLYRKDFLKIVSPAVLDTMWMSRMKTSALTDEFGKHNHTDACARAGVELFDAHRAMPDTAANAELVKSYLKALRGAGEAVVVKKEEHEYREEFKF